ncbi:MAG: LegC family aminotransferase [Alphaproteobacteria bacterium]|nr:LegC family aminotransferase [Alphaproteobacteria bacterium]
MANTRSDEARVSADAPIPLSVPVLSGREWQYVKECLDTNWVSSAGLFIERFERATAAALNAEHAVAVVNGTAALHLAMVLLGVGPGDEVVVPALTFIATANAVRYTGAVPAILDVEADYWQLDAAKLEAFLREGCIRHNGTLSNKATGRRIAAILPVHALGHPCDMDAIIAVADPYGIPVVEDAAEAIGARYKGRYVGTIGRMGCLSFNGNKTITCGGGGMILTGDAKIAARARYLSSQAKDDEIAYVHSEIGYNYRLTNVLAAIGLAQIEKLDEHIAAKERIARRYYDGLAGIPGLTPMLQANWAQNVHWLFTILIDSTRFGLDNMTLLNRLLEAGIETRPLWQPMHRSSALRDAFVHSEITVADRVHAQALSLPSSVNLTPEQQDRVIASIKQASRA